MNHRTTEKTEDSSAGYKCEYCDRTYKTRGTLKKHEGNCSRKPRKDETVGKLKRRMNSCRVCGKTFKYAKILEKHEAMHDGKFPFWCKLCMRNFQTYDEKALHKAAEHPNKGKKRKCRLCPDTAFETEEEHLYHINEAHKGKADDYYMCSDCGKQFKTKSELTHHNNSKCGTIRQYKCKICSQDLMTAGSLHNHMLRHTGERCCMCGYCGKMFLTVGQLKVHERTHTQEKAFICNVCGKGFCHRQSLITHSTLHTGVKPYQCDNCGNSFSCVGNLIKHRRTHADTCGATPLTTHRVNNPSTKMKVKINTPNTSKLKTVRREREVQEKLAAYKEKLSLRSCGRADGGRGCEFNEEEEAAAMMGDVPYVPNGLVDPASKTELENGTNYSLKPELHKNQSKNSSELLKLLNNNEEYDDNLERIQKSDVPKPTQNNLLLSETRPIAIESSIKTQLNEKNAKDYLCHENNEAFEENNDDDYYEPGEDCYDLGNDFVEDNIKAEEEDESRLSTNVGYLDENNSRCQKKRAKISEKEVKEFIQQRSFQDLTEGTCQYCSKLYTNFRWLLRHELEHERKLNQSKTCTKYPYKCSCCKVSFKSKDECKTHQKNMHAQTLTCQECDKFFSNLDSLRSHQNVFHKGLPRKIYVYVCEKCGLQFRQKAFLDHHERNNCGAGPVYECHVCGKGFNSVHTRRSHLRIHDPKKKFLCKFCGKSFRWKGQLKIHERSHTGEKPFKCLYCPKAFAYRESLVTHSSLHTGIKPHLCQACGSRFSCIGNLIKHRATHATTCGVWYSKNQ